MKKLLATTLFTAILLLTSQAQAKGLLNVKDESDSIERFSIQGGLGVNVFLPFAHVKASYLLPTKDNNIQITGEYSFLNAAMSTVPLKSFSIGANYYFTERKGFNPYINAGVFGMFNTADTDFISKKQVPAKYLGTALYFGIGTDLMITDNIGLSGEVNILPVFYNTDNGFQGGFNVRPEANIKFAF